MRAPSTAVARTLYSTTTPGGARREVTVLELLDRLLDRGVVIRGQIELAVAGVDLISLDLAIVLASIEKAIRPWH